VKSASAGKKAVGKPPWAIVGKKKKERRRRLRPIGICPFLPLKEGGEKGRGASLVPFSLTQKGKGKGRFLFGLVLGNAGLPSIKGEEGKSDFSQNFMKGKKKKKENASMVSLGGKLGRKKEKRKSRIPAGKKTGPVPGDAGRNNTRKKRRGRVGNVN